MFTLYSDAELATLIAQVKAAIPKVLSGQRVKIGESEYDRTSLEALEAFGAKLGREYARRTGTAKPRLVTVRMPRRGGSWRLF